MRRILPSDYFNPTCQRKTLTKQRQRGKANSASGSSRISKQSNPLRCLIGHVKSATTTLVILDPMTTAEKELLQHQGGPGTPQTPVLSVACRILRSPSHESVTTDLSLFSVSSATSDAHRRLLAFGKCETALRGHSPNPDNRHQNR